MKSNRTADNRNSHDLTAQSGKERPASVGLGSPVPPSWQRLVTGLRGARLYRVRLPFGVGYYWEAGVMLNGEPVHRRFASELHARAWISMATEPEASQNPFNMEELNEGYRTAGILRGGKAMA